MKITDEMIEALSRKLCADRGYDPDMHGAMGTPWQLTTPAGPVTTVPANVYPVWNFWAQEARSALESATGILEQQGGRHDDHLRH